jgi:putative transposase
MNATGIARTFFVTTSPAAGRALFQTDRMANLFIEALRAYVNERRFTIHDFVVMPNHVHILITIPGEMTIEKAIQFIKGNFSFRAARELGFKGEVWQRGFSDVRITDEQSFRDHQDYINQNPVKAGLAPAPGDYAFGSAHLKKQKKIRNEALQS